MRYLLFADIHGNLEALLSVLKFVQKKRIDHYLFMGDVVGYGASPNEVIQKLQGLKPLSTVRGNHDKAVCGLDSVETFNPIAASAIHWTKERISKRSLAFVLRQKKGPLFVDGTISLCHGAPFDEDYYIFGEFDAAEAFHHIQTQICFFGHTHFPFVYSEKDGVVEGTFMEGNTVEVRLEKDTRYLVNPGSVGQPRDRNPRSSCAIYDSETRLLKFFRLEYNIEEAQRKILAERLPPALAERLSLGI